jgi:hypothetical protein
MRLVLLGLLLEVSCIHAFSTRGTDVYLLLIRLNAASKQIRFYWACLCLNVLGRDLLKRADRTYKVLRVLKNDDDVQSICCKVYNVVTQRYDLLRCIEVAHVISKNAVGRGKHDGIVVQHGALEYLPFLVYLKLVCLLGLVNNCIEYVIVQDNSQSGVVDKNSAQRKVRQVNYSLLSNLSLVNLVKSHSAIPTDSYKHILLIRNELNGLNRVMRKLLLILEQYLVLHDVVSSGLARGVFIHIRVLLWKHIVVVSRSIEYRSHDYNKYNLINYLDLKYSSSFF